MLQETDSVEQNNYRDNPRGHSHQTTMLSVAHLAAYAALASQVHAHGYVNLLKTGGKFYPGWDIIYYYGSTPSGVAGWSTTALDSGFVSGRCDAVSTAKC